MLTGRHEARPLEVVFHLTGAFRTLLNADLEQPDGSAELARAPIDAALATVDGAGGDWLASSDWVSRASIGSHYKSVASDDVTILQQPLFVLTALPELAEAALAATVASRLPPGVTATIGGVSARIYGNTIGILTASLTVGVPDSAALGSVLDGIDEATHALCGQLAVSAQVMLEPLIGAMLRVARERSAPISIQQPGRFRTFVDLNSLQASWPEPEQAAARWPDSADPQLWTNRILFLPDLDADAETLICDHWRVPAVEAEPVPGVLDLRARINVGNSVFAGRYTTFLAHHLDDTMARVQLFYAELGVLRANLRMLNTGLSHRISPRSYREQRETLSLSNAAVNIAISELTDHRTGVQGARKWFFDKLYQCFEMDLLMEAVRLRQRTVQERSSDLQTTLFARNDRVIESLVFLLGALSLIGTLFALLTFVKEDFSPGDRALGEWSSGPLVLLRGVSSDILVMLLCAIIIVLMVFYARRSRH